MSKKILVVDDEPNIVMTLEYALKKKNYAVVIARDGHEAIKLLESEQPDLILLDVMMPELDGYETLLQIKANEAHKNVKVVFLTAKNKTSDIEKGLKMGADGYITKPFSIKKVTTEIEKLLL